MSGWVVRVNYHKHGGGRCVEELREGWGGVGEAGVGLSQGLLHHERSGGTIRTPRVN